MSQDLPYKWRRKKLAWNATFATLSVIALIFVIADTTPPLYTVVGIILVLVIKEVLMSIAWKRIRMSHLNYPRDPASISWRRDSGAKT